MTSTHFVDRDSTTPIVADWLNDVNLTVYQALGSGGVAPTSPAAVRANLGYAAPSGATNVGFTRTDTGAVARTVAGVMLDYASVKDFGAMGDGVTDDTAAINAATLAVTALGKALFFPAGTYLVTYLICRANLRWSGENKATTILKWKNGTNPALDTAMVDCPQGILVTAGSFIPYAVGYRIKSIGTTDFTLIGAVANTPGVTFQATGMGTGTGTAETVIIYPNISFENLTFDGNYQNNTTNYCHILHLVSYNPRLNNIKIINSPGNGIFTETGINSWANGIYFGQFTHISIEYSQMHGWYCAGPSDSHYSDIIIKDVSLSYNAGYYGLYLDPNNASNGRFNQIHLWEGSNGAGGASVNSPFCGVFVGSSGSSFTGCHFESGHLPLNIAGGSNTFTSCMYYASKGGPTSYIIGIGGGVNYVSGVLYGYTGFETGGINLIGPDNTIDILVAGSGTSPAINFADATAGGNNIRLGGWSASGSVYAGIPSYTDNIDINVQGPTGILLKQQRGTMTNDNVATFCVGEYLEAYIDRNSPTTVTSGVPTNLTTLTLTAGDWEVGGLVGVIGAPTTALNLVQGGTSLISTSLGDFRTFIIQDYPDTIIGAVGVAHTLPNQRYSLAATSTLYLIVDLQFGLSTCSAYGQIWARRIR